MLQAGAAARALERRNALLQGLHHTALGLLERLEPGELLAALADSARSLVDATDSYVYVVDPEREQLIVRAAAGRAVAKYHGSTLSRGEGIAGKVWETGEPLVVRDYATWSGRSEKISPTDVRAVVALPLTIHGKVFGVLGIAHSDPGAAFDEDEVWLLKQYAPLASIAIDHAQLLTRAHDSELLFRTAFEAARIGRGITAPTGEWVMVNDAFCEMVGRTREEMLALTSAAITHPDDVEPTLIQRQRTLAGEQSGYTLEKRFVRKDGSVMWATTSVAVVRDAAGAPLFLIGDVVDITERKRAESQARGQAVTKELVRRMLQGIAHRGVASAGMMRDIGRDLASGVRASDTQGYLDAFGTMGLGEMRLLGREGSRYRFAGSELLERERKGTQATCHLPLGFLEQAVAALEGQEALGTETTCQSKGDAACTFVVAPRARRAPRDG